MVTFSTSRGNEEKLVIIPDFRQEECPISTMSRLPQMDMLVTEVMNMARVKESTGAVPFGADSAKWPARWHDAVRLAWIEDCRFEDAREEVRESLSRG